MFTNSVTLGLGPFFRVKMNLIPCLFLNKLCIEHGFPISDITISYGPSKDRKYNSETKEYDEILHEFVEARIAGLAVRIGKIEEFFTVDWFVDVALECGSRVKIMALSDNTIFPIWDPVSVFRRDAELTLLSNW